MDIISTIGVIIFSIAVLGFLYQIFGNIVTYLAILFVVTTAFEWVFGALTPWKAILIVATLPFVALVIKYLRGIPVSAYVGRYSDGNLFVQIVEDENGLEMKYNLDVENDATIKVSRRALMLGNIKLVLVPGGLKACLSDGECIILHRDERKIR